MIELNRSRNNVVLSRRAVLEEERKEVRQQILDRLQPGMVVEGAISNIVDFGAFVDLDGIDGLIHISRAFLEPRQPSLGDPQHRRHRAGQGARHRSRPPADLARLKQTQEDPWQRVVDTYRVGDDSRARSTKVVTFGAFVEIMDGVEASCTSPSSRNCVENPREVVEPGDDVRVKILEIDSSAGGCR